MLWSLMLFVVTTDISSSRLISSVSSWLSLHLGTQLQLPGSVLPDRSDGAELKEWSGFAVSLWLPAESLGDGGGGDDMESLSSSLLSVECVSLSRSFVDGTGR